MKCRELTLDYDGINYFFEYLRVVTVIDKCNAWPRWTQNGSKALKENKWKYRVPTFEVSELKPYEIQKSVLAGELGVNQ